MFSYTWSFSFKYTAVYLLCTSSQVQKSHKVVSHRTGSIPVPAMVKVTLLYKVTYIYNKVTFLCPLKKVNVKTAGTEFQYNY